MKRITAKEAEQFVPLKNDMKSDISLLRCLKYIVNIIDYQVMNK